MKRSRGAKTLVSILACGLVAVVAIGTGEGLTACGESAGCTKFRNETYAAKQMWSVCDPSKPEPCVKISGNGKDCSGVLTCDFAVDPQFRTEAEQAVLTAGEQTQGCFLCATPNCVTGDIAYCDPVLDLCVVSGMFVNGSPTFPTQPSGGDAGPSPAPTTEPPADAQSLGM